MKSGEMFARRLIGDLEFFSHESRKSNRILKYVLKQVRRIDGAELFTQAGFEFFMFAHDSKNYILRDFALFTNCSEHESDELQPSVFFRYIAQEPVIFISILVQVSREIKYGQIEKTFIDELKYH